MKKISETTLTFSIVLFHARPYKHINAWFKPSDLFKVTVYYLLKINNKNNKMIMKLKHPRCSLYNLYNPTTSFLTTTIILCTWKAGITAAAGTRLALSFTNKLFKLEDFQSKY